MKSRTILEVVAIAATIVLVTTSCSDSAKPGSGAKVKPDLGAQVSSNTPISIEPGVSMGKVRDGMSVEEVIAQLGKPDGEHGRFLEYRRLGFAVGYDRDRVVKTIMCGGSSGVEDPLTLAFTGRTKDGLGMGSSRDEVVKSLGKPSEVQKGPAAQETLKYSPLGLTFTLMDGKVFHMIVDFRVDK
jgi:hypothetical protein